MGHFTKTTDGTLHKDNRWDTSKPLYFYNDEKFKRAFDGIKKSLNTNDHGCINLSLLDIPEEKVKR